MNWQEVAIEDLKSYNSYWKSLNNAYDRIHILNQTMRNCRTSRLSLLPANHGTATRSTEDLWLDCIAEKSDLELSIGLEKKKIEMIDKGLQSLSEEQRFVLTTFYVNRPQNHVDVVCEKLNVEKTKVYKLKDEALKRFTLEQYGVSW